MRFAATHKLVSYLMVSTAFLVLALSGELPTGLSAVTSVGIFASFFFDPQRRPFMMRRPWNWGWTVALLVALTYAVVQYLHGESLLAVGTPYLCYLLLGKLWNRKQNRDYLQAYVISFFMLVAGTVLNNNMVYALCFVFYVIFSTWTLTLFHLRREMEENYLLKHVQGKDGKAAESERVEVDRILNSRRVVGKEFLLGTSLISVAIFLTSAVIFFLTPRIGLSLDIPLQRHGMTTSGFSDRIELGGHGRIRDNPQIVMRVEVPSGKPGGPLHLRGVSFDHYERGRWSRSRNIEPTPFTRFISYHFVDAGPNRLTSRDAERLLSGTLRTEVFLEPIDVAVLFAPSRVVAVTLPETLLPEQGMKLVPGPGGELFVRDRKAGMHYTAYSDIRSPPQEDLAKAPELPKEHDADLDVYMQVPKDLPPRVRKLAADLTQNAHSPHEKATAILRYLQGYAYTTQIQRDERYEPIEDFLFVQKRGHCEYFASAMAILLRLSGVPTRSINGYLGGSEWNDYGHYLVVRQQDTHSWVEVYLEGRGWVTYDPTPPSALLLNGSMIFQSLRQIVDNLELSWFKYVIEYDLRAQIEMARNVKIFLDRDRKQKGGPGLRDFLAHALRRARTFMPLLLPLFLLALGYVVRRYWRMRKADTRVPGGRAHVLIRRALVVLKCRGYVQRPGETLQGLAARVTAAGDPTGPPFATLVERFYAVRFGGEAPDAAAFRDLLRAVAQSPLRPEEEQPPRRRMSWRRGA